MNEKGLFPQDVRSQGFMGDVQQTFTQKIMVPVAFFALGYLIANMNKKGELK